MPISVGAIADDFTGATDLANTLSKEGLRVSQLIGVPREQTSPGEVDAIVVALKTRSIVPADAVAQSLAAFEWLQAQGAEQILFKYCSTFDSTAEGNIGPVADALMDALDINFALVCPAYPENGRTIFKGNLHVGDVPLAESSMKDHPLTPMRDSNLVRLMQAQSHKKVGLIPYEAVESGVEAVEARIAVLKASGCTYGVADAISDRHLQVLGEAAKDQKLITGGSGIAIGLPANFSTRSKGGTGVSSRMPQTFGRSLVLAGSCSAATRAQIAQVKNKWPAVRINVDALAREEDVVSDLSAWAEASAPDLPVLIYASADPEEVAAVQKRYGAERAGGLVEKAFGQLVQRLTAKGFTRLVVAGGETSGAVVSALGISHLRIGPEIAPGVPWTESLQTPAIALALKSGNFGGSDFFETAFSMFEDRRWPRGRGHENTEDRGRRSGVFQSVSPEGLAADRGGGTCRADGPVC